MKNLLIGLLIMFIVWPIGNTYAAQRVVTSHIISDVWYENIFLIADMEDNMATKNFTVQIGGGGRCYWRRIIIQFSKLVQ